MPGALETPMQGSGMAAMEALQKTRQAVAILWGDQQVDMIAHQTKGLNRDSVMARIFFQPVQ